MHWVQDKMNLANPIELATFRRKNACDDCMSVRSDSLELPVQIATRNWNFYENP